MAENHPSKAPHFAMWAPFSCGTVLALLHTYLPRAHTQFTPRVQDEFINHLTQGVMTMIQRSNTVAATQPVQRLWMLGSVLLIGAAAAAFSVSALAGGHRGAHGDHGAKSGHHGETCMHEGQGGRHAGGGMMGEGRHLDRLLGDAKLTDAQRTQIRDIQTQARADLKALHGPDGMPMHHGMSLLAEAKPDATAAEKARQQMLARHDKVSQRMLKAQLDIANVLTPAQRAQIATAMKARHDRMSERMNKRAEHRAAHHAERAASMPAARPSAPR